MASIKEQIEDVESDEFELINVNQNRDVTTISYQTELAQSELRVLIEQALPEKELFGIKFDKESTPNTNEPYDVMKFRTT